MVSSPSPPLPSAVPPDRILRVDGVPDRTMRAALTALRTEFDLLAGASPAATEAAAAAAARGPSDPTPRIDRTDLPLVTVDPRGSRDLDQALHLEPLADGGARVHYAIADVAAFVTPGDPIDREAHARGETLYAPDGNLPLHPPSLSEGAASLLAGERRPALLWTIEIDGAGGPGAARVERAWVQSREQLDYDQAQRALDAGTAPEGLAPLATVGPLLVAAETARGGVSLPLPEQVVRIDDGRWSLAFRSMLPVERWNAQLSLLTGMAAARMMLAAGQGILRTLPPPAGTDLERLRHSARALGVAWPPGLSYGEMVHNLDPQRPAHAAMLAACQRLLRGSGYRTLAGPAAADRTTVHAGLAAPYAHVTAPLRRLVDRYALEVCVALSADRPVPTWVTAALDELPATMARCGQRGASFDDAVLSLVEAAVLAPHRGEHFAGVVVARDDQNPLRGRLTVADPAVTARISGPEALPVGRPVRALLEEADPATRTVRFALTGDGAAPA